MLKVVDVLGLPDIALPVVLVNEAQAGLLHPPHGLAVLGVHLGHKAEVIFLYARLQLLAQVHADGSIAQPQQLLNTSGAINRRRLSDRHKQLPSSGTLEH